jgi:hypothetical protein
MSRFIIKTLGLATLSLASSESLITPVGHDIDAV